MEEFLITLIKSVITVVIPLTAIPLILQVERRGAAFIQRRLGPNRVGPFGLLQPLADAVKFLFKEEVTPSHVKRFFFSAAPIVALIIAILPLAALPVFAPFEWQGKLFYAESFQSPLGVFYIFAVSELAAYGILLAGWASNNKFSMLGALRATAQMVSYELALSLTIISLLVIYGTVDLHKIVAYQSQTFFLFLPKWGVLLQPVGAIIFLVCIFAESNRLPFDLAEGESELVAGYHVEYSSFKFAMFYMAEYVHMIVLSALYILLFFGGYELLPGFSWLAAKGPSWTPLFQSLSFIIKIALMIWIFVWVRWSLPRFRYDQLMRLGWKVLFPLGLVNLIITILVVSRLD